MYHQLENKYQFTDKEITQHCLETGHRTSTRMGYPYDSDEALWTCTICAKEAIEDHGVCGICHQLGWDVAVSGPLFRGVAHRDCWGDMLTRAEAYIRSSQVDER